MSLEQIKVELLDWWPKEGDKDIAHAAWASTFDQERIQAKTETDVFRVVKQIVEHAHDTPKEGVSMKFFISCPLYVERQLDKYRMTVQAQDFQIEWLEGKFGRDHITQNELSGRYRTMPEFHYTLPHDVRNILLELGTSESTDAIAAYENVLDKEYEAYKRVLNAFPAEWKKQGHEHNKHYKRVREVLRGLLGTAYFTNMRIVCNLNAFEHIINQRLAADTQLETRYAAYLMLHEVLKNGVAAKAVLHMYTKHKWFEWCNEMDAYLTSEQRRDFSFLTIEEKKADKIQLDQEEVQAIRNILDGSSPALSADKLQALQSKLGF